MGANKLRFISDPPGFSPVLGQPKFRRRKFNMKNIVSKVQRFLKSEDGPTAVEYAIMLALIVIVCLAAIQSVGTDASSRFDDIAQQLN